MIGLQNGNPTYVLETDTTLKVCISINNAIVLDIPINVQFEAISGTAKSKSINMHICIFSSLIIILSELRTVRMFNSAISL